MLPRLAVLGTALLCSLSASAFELTHSQGQLKLAATPQKIVSFDLATLDSLNALNVPVAGVPQSTYKNELAKYRETLVIGTLFEPNYAALNALKPDLIFSSGRANRAVEELKKIAPTVQMASDTNAFMKTFNQSNQDLARAFGKQKVAQPYLERINRNVNALQQANRGKTGAFLFVVNNNVSTQVPGDRFGYAFELTGLKAVLPAKDPNAPATPRPAAGSPEAKRAAEERAQALVTLAKAEPDWLLVLDRGAINDAPKTAAQVLAKHPEISKTQAFQRGRVVYLDPNGWYVIGGGLNNLTAITEHLLSTMK